MLDTERFMNIDQPGREQQFRQRGQDGAVNLRM
jgi:hypothetical protein